MTSQSPCCSKFCGGPDGTSLNRPTVSAREGGTVTMALGAALHYISVAGLHGALGDISPGPYRSLRELSLTGLVGSDTRRPPTSVGNPGSTLRRPMRLRTFTTRFFRRGRACPGHPRP